MRATRTLGIVKPDAVGAGNAGAILALIEAAGFTIRGLKMTRLSAGQAGEFYDVHRGKPFYQPLIEFMTSGPIIAMVLEKEEAVIAWRTLMGATDPSRAVDGTLRKRFGTAVQHNAVHGSDSLENAAREIGFFFSAAELL